MKFSKSKSKAIKYGLDEDKSYEGLCKCAKMEKETAPAALIAPPRSGYR